MNITHYQEQEEDTHRDTDNMKLLAIVLSNTKMATGTKCEVVKSCSTKPQNAQQRKSKFI